MAGRVIAIVGFGQNRKSYPSLYESALPLKPDIGNERRHVHFGPTGDSRIATNGCLFDQFIGAGKQRRRHAKAQCLRSLEIDDELKSGGKLYRQIGRLRAF